MPLDKFRETNLKQWEERVGIHWDAEDYGVQRFISDSSHVTRIIRFDQQYLGDLSGKKLAHLQCHIGMDTLSLARLGAEVTGVDFSPSAIRRAEELSRLSGTPGRFIRSEFYDIPGNLEETFDIIYTSIGVLGWLPDIRGWGRIVADLLAPGGFVYVRELHPMAWTLDDERTDGQLVLRFPYFETEKPEVFYSDTSYAGESKLTNRTEYSWNHGLSETIGALIDSGLRLDFLHEFKFLDWPLLPGMVRSEDGTYSLPEGQERLPLEFAVRATKP